MNEQINRCPSRMPQLCWHSVVDIKNNCFATGHKKERNLSAKRKDAAEVFIPSKPEPNPNPQQRPVFPDQERPCSSKSSGGCRARVDWAWVTLGGPWGDAVIEEALL